MFIIRIKNEFYKINISEIIAAVNLTPLLTKDKENNKISIGFI